MLVKKWIFMFLLLSTCNAYAGFADGFKRGSDAAAEGLEAGYRAQEQRRLWAEMKARYGTPAMDKFHALERDSEIIFLQLRRAIIMKLDPNALVPE